MSLLSDVELAALTSLVNQETELMRAFNAHREQKGWSPGYTTDTGFSEYCLLLEKELKSRLSEKEVISNEG